MTNYSLIAFGFVLAAIILFIVVSITLRGDRPVVLRSIPAFRIINQMIGRSVEEGKTLHITQGAGSLIGRQSAIGFTGLVILGNISRISMAADKPAVCTTGDGGLIILSQDTLRHAYRQSIKTGVQRLYQARYTGATPAAYVSGVIMAMLDEPAAGSILIGSFNSLAVLMTGLPFSDHTSLAAADSLPAQAALYTCANESLVAEEVYAAGAYSGPDTKQTAGLITQDILRWLFIGLGLVYIVLGLLGVI
ncbi:MAG: hypothetical protein JXR32_05695 [Anaerolineaceae bacterium]|nr:hypothetical protein [Anaerolineaceae bacterium]